MPTPLPVRTQAARTVAAVLQQRASLASLMAPALEAVADDQRPLLQELCFGTLRWQPALQALLGRLLDKPLRSRDSDVQALLLIGLYQLHYLRTPDHAAVAATVEACRPLQKAWAGKLINAILRRFLRERETLLQQLAASPAWISAHPNWLRKQIEQHWPGEAAAVFAANNDHPPFTLRLNTALCRRKDYLQQLHDAGIEARATPYSDTGVTLLRARDVHRVPGFDQGLVSVQDEAAQLAAGLLQLAPGQRVLDACCAPGGKTGHLLELAATLPAPLAQLQALELEPRRLERVRENLARLPAAVTAATPWELLCADARDRASWWDGRVFDCILLDAPCSASGIVRRQPDIKVLRKATDIAKLAALQLQLLHALWPTLRPGGQLLYATCSLLPQENRAVVAQFLAQQQDARECPLAAPWGQAQTAGRQLLPQPGGHDGFYYASLYKVS